MKGHDSQSLPCQLSPLLEAYNSSWLDIQQWFTGYWVRNCLFHRRDCMKNCCSASVKAKPEHQLTDRNSLHWAKHTSVKDTHARPFHINLAKYLNCSIFCISNGRKQFTFARRLITLSPSPDTHSINLLSKHPRTEPRRVLFSTKTVQESVPTLEQVLWLQSQRTGFQPGKLVSELHQHFSSLEQRTVYISGWRQRYRYQGAT